MIIHRIGILKKGLKRSINPCENMVSPSPKDLRKKQLVAMAHMDCRMKIYSTPIPPQNHHYPKIENGHFGGIPEFQINPYCNCSSLCNARDQRLLTSSTKRLRLLLPLSLQEVGTLLENIWRFPEMGVP